MANTRFSYVKHFEQETILLPESWPVIRVDGRGFTKFSKLHQFRKPNEPLALGVMNAAAAHVMSTFEDILLAYGHSDEYSFLFRRESRLYNRRMQKILSSVVSTFSAAYCFYWNQFYPGKPLKSLPTFDGRIVLYPRFENIVDYFSWRHADCHINNQYNICFWCLVADGKRPEEAYKWLKHTQKGEKNEYIFQSRGINYNNLPRIFRKGTTLVRLAEPRADVTTSASSVGTNNSIDQWRSSNTSSEWTPSENTDVIELTIGDSEISNISRQLDSICSGLGIGVVHCDNTSSDFWRALAPSYDTHGGVEFKKGIVTLSALSREQINLLNAGR